MHTKSHRHFVAVPLACLLLTFAAGVHAVLPATGAALTGSTFEHEATVIEAKDMRRTVDIGWRLQGILEPQTRLRIGDQTHVTFLAGEAILSFPGYAVLALEGDRSLVLVDATVWVRRDGAQWTAVPLDAPVLFRSSDAMTIVPPAQQLRIGSTAQLSAVPTDWMAQRLSEAASIRAAGISAAGAPSPQDDEAILAATLDSDTILAADDVRSLLSLGGRIDHSGVLAGLMAYRLGCDPGSYDDEADTFLSEAFRLSPVAPEGARRLPALVRSQPKPVAEWLVNDWYRLVMRQGVDDPDSTIAALREYAGLPNALRLAGYPLQSDTWQSALARAEQTLLPLLRAEDPASSEAPVSVGSMQPSSSGSSAPAALRYTEKQLLALARQLLVEHGVLTGSATHLLPLAGPPQAVRVVGIFIAEDGKDVPYEFIYDPAAHALSRIIRDGTEQPNTVPVDMFFGQ